MAKFIVKGRVKYNGVLYASGSVVEVADKDAAEFKKHGWELAKAGKQKEGEGEGQGQKEGEVKLDMNSKKDDIIAELKKRNVEFDEKFTKAELLALLV